MCLDVMTNDIRKDIFIHVLVTRTKFWFICIDHLERMVDGGIVGNYFWFLSTQTKNIVKPYRV
jgi:hypothetical protein